MLTDIVDGVLHGANLLGVLVRDLDVKSFFERHDQLYGVQRIGAEIVYKRCARSDFALIHSQLLYDDLFYLLVYGCHVSPRLPRLDYCEQTSPISLWNVS